MEIGVSGQDRDLQLQLKGELGHHGAKWLMSRLDREIEAAMPLRLVLDFSDISFMDSSGIVVVMLCRQRMRKLGDTVSLRGLA